MNYCAIQQNGVDRSGDDVRSSFSATMFLPDHRQRRENVVCPKPRRANHPSRPFAWNLSHEADLSDSKARSELLDMILAKGSNYKKGSSPPPFFCGSPPSRVSNPLIQDALFREEKIVLPSSPSPSGVSGLSLSPTSAKARKGGCVRATFGNNPAVRVEGFDCLDRDRSRNCRIPALA